MTLKNIFALDQLLAKRFVPAAEGLRNQFQARLKEHLNLSVWHFASVAFSYTPSTQTLRAGLSARVCTTRSGNSQKAKKYLFIPRARKQERAFTRSLIAVGVCLRRGACVKNSRRENALRLLCLPVPFSPILPRVPERRLREQIRI